MWSELLQGVAIEPRPYQQRIVQKAIEMFEGRWINRYNHLESAAHSVMIESPTGSGKTVMGLTVARYMQEQHGMKIGWVAMRRNLLLQAEHENSARQFGLKLHLISMFDKNPPEVDFLVIDEAQHDAATSSANLHSIIKPKKVLGLSATPYRTDRVKLCFEKVITDAGIHALIQDGYLSPYHHYTIPNYSPEAVAECFLREPEKWGKTLLFFHRQEQCDACANILRQQDWRVEVVTAKTNRDKQLEAFESGKVDVLLSMAILTEGFDCPSLKTVFVRPSGKGCTVQMAGRVLRKHPDFPFKQMVQCKNTRHPFLRTAAAAEQYVWAEDSWRALKVNSKLDAISFKALQVIANTDSQLPAYIAARRTPTPNRFRFGNFNEQ